MGGLKFPFMRGQIKAIVSAPRVEIDGVLARKKMNGRGPQQPTRPHLEKGGHGGKRVGQGNGERARSPSSQVGARTRLTGKGPAEPRGHTNFTKKMETAVNREGKKR